MRLSTIFISSAFVLAGMSTAFHAEKRNNMLGARSADSDFSSKVYRRAYYEDQAELYARSRDNYNTVSRRRRSLYEQPPRYVLARRAEHKPNQPLHSTQSGSASISLQPIKQPNQPSAKSDRPKLTVNTNVKTSQQPSTVHQSSIDPYLSQITGGHDKPSAVHTEPSKMDDSAIDTKGGWN